MHVSHFSGEAQKFLGPVDTKVEFDTLMNVELKDINGNHVELDLNSMVSSQVSDLGAVGVVGGLRRPTRLFNI